jgi:hypothetical protein
MPVRPGLEFLQNQYGTRIFVMKTNQAILLFRPSTTVTPLGFLLLRNLIGSL